MFVDFDGTLSPIVDDPWRARALPGAADLLARLASWLGRVAVVSGRPVAFLLEHLPGAGAAELHGLYGLEWWNPGTGEVDAHREAAGWRSAVSAAAARAHDEVAPGVAVEPKGLTLTLHYRAVPDRRADVERLAFELAGQTGLVPHRGKMSIELRPPVAIDKGTVVDRLTRGLEAAAFCGDDLGDVPALDALARMRSAGRVTLSVVAAGAETPDQVLSRADVVVAGPPGVLDLLRRLDAPG